MGGGSGCFVTSWTLLYCISGATVSIDAGNQEYFTISVVGEELIFTVVTPDLSLNHDCGVFQTYTNFLYLVYELKCANGDTTTISVKGASIFSALKCIQNNQAH